MRTVARSAIWSLVDALFAPIDVPGYGSLYCQALKLQVDRRFRKSLPAARVINLLLAPTNEAIDVACPLFPNTRSDLEIVGLTGLLGVPDVSQFHYHLVALLKNINPLGSEE